MMTLPTWIDFRYAERTAAVMARNLCGASDKWGTLLAMAQGVLSFRTDTRDSESQASYDFGEWEDLTASARILDLAASERGLRAPEDRQAAAILAACAFGMSGNTVSAAAVIQSHRLLDAELSFAELTALALSSPRFSRQVFPRLPGGSKYRACIENITAFLVKGSDDPINTAIGALEEAIQEETGVWEGYLLRLSRLSLAHTGRLAVAKALAQHKSAFPQGYLDKLVSDSPILLPSQYEAISEHEVLTPDRNLLITLPTGTGKTLLGELALLSSLGQEPGLVCYVAPYVALAHQVAEKLAGRIPTAVRVHRLMGGYKEPDPLNPESHQEVVIATPERFDAMLRLRPELLPSIRCAVFDEAHMIGNGQRGIRLEGVLTRLKIAGPRNTKATKLVLLSAVISNVDALAAWMDVAHENVIRGSWRPSAKRLLRWNEDGSLRLHSGDDPLRRNNPAEILGQTQLPWPNVKFHQSIHHGDIRKQEPKAMENVAFLADFVYDWYRQPVLCVCSTRPKTRQLAHLIAQRFRLLTPLPEPIRTITALIDGKYQHLRPLKEALQRGVAYHNSSLPQGIREGIERAVEQRTLKVVAATTTLAEGVDLPFRVTILADWLMFDGKQNRPMESLLFKNIAGRCGRAGQFTEGDTIIFDNPVGDARLTFPTRRFGLQEDIFFQKSQPALTSAIIQLEKQAAVSTVGSQLLAAIPENNDVDDLASHFFESSFAKRTESATKAKERINLVYKDILDPSDGQPLAAAVSPVRLTTFGEAASRSGLSPTTARRLRKALGELAGHGASRDDLITISDKLLTSLGNVDEQGNPDLRKALQNPKSRPVVRLDELKRVLDFWLKGESMEYIFANLPANQRSTRKPKLQTWLHGASEDSAWTDQFAKFHDFMGNCVQRFLPWMLRAAQPLADMEDCPERPWVEWARFTELGVDSAVSVRLMEEDIITERSTARRVGHFLDQQTPAIDTSDEGFRESLADALDGREQDLTRVMDCWVQLTESLQ